MLTIKDYFYRILILIIFPVVMNVQDSNAQFKLTILHNNDAESQLVNAGSGPLSDFGGAARFKTLLDTLRAQATANGYNVVLLSSGDNFLAGPEFFLSLQLPPGVPMYDSRIMDAFDYDAICMGNHEFDFGPDVLARFIRGFNTNQAPWLSSNLGFSMEDSLQSLVNQGRIAKTTVIDYGGQKVGIIGATTPKLKSISSPRNVTVDTNVVAIVQSLADSLENAGVNKIILISHLQSIKEDSALCRQLTKIDVMIAGGGDEVLANPNTALVTGDTSEVYGPYPIVVPNAMNDDVYLITTAGSYKYIGRFAATFDNNGVITSFESNSGPVRVAGGSYPDSVTPNAQLQNSIVDSVIAGLNGLATNVIGNTTVPLNGIRSNVRTRETNEGNLCADAILWKAQQLAPSFGSPMPNVGIQNGGGIRNDAIIPVGPVSELTTFDVFPFSNFVCVVPGIPPHQFKEIMENAVSRVEFTDGRFAQISGFKIKYDKDARAQVVNDSGIVQTTGNRIFEIQLDNGTYIVQNGAVVSGAPSVNMAIVDFSARGGDQYPFRGANFITMGATYQNALLTYITDGLSGSIDSVSYPFNSEGRIVQDSNLISVQSIGENVPGTYDLAQNFPNPFNPSTRIRFGIPKSGLVTVKVYDMLGKEVATLVNEELRAGSYEVPFDGSYFSSGMYFYRIQSGEFVETKKMILVK